MRLAIPVEVIRFATRRGWILTTVLFPAVVLLGPIIGLGTYGQHQIVLIVLLSLIVSGLNLCYGYAGELALGQIAIYATGAYVAGYLAIHLTSDVLVGVVVAALVAPIVGFVTGIPGLRLGGWSLAMVSFFLVLAIPEVVDILKKYTGGGVGLSGMPQSTLFGSTLSTDDMYYVVVGLAAIWFAILRNLVTSRSGKGLLVIRASPVLASAVGLSPFRFKLGAYMVAGIPAGIAGALLSDLNRYIIADYFTFSLAVAILAGTILGGRTSVYGAVLGATVLQLGPLRAGAFSTYSFVVYGALLILGGSLLPSGLVGIFRWVVRQLTAEGRHDDSAELEVPPLALNGKLLEVSQAAKSFGGVVALGGVDLVARPGRVTSIIGPNGSGKTTLLNLINGYYHPDAGTVSLDGHQIHRLSAYRISRLGVARTFQTPIVSEDLSVIETAAVGRVGLARTSLLSVVFRLPRYRRISAADSSLASVALRRVGLGEFASAPGSSLPLGSRRMLEFARTLAADPSVILLDEVASGVDEDTLADLAQLIRALADAGATVVLVEHNFSLVLNVSDEIYVLANGRLITSGTPDEIANHPEVLEQYLGTPAVVQEASP